MGQRGYPPLKLREVVAIVIALGFSLKLQKGSHAQYERPAHGNQTRAVVTIDTAYDEVKDPRLIKSPMRQAQCATIEEFYNAVENSKGGKKASMVEARCACTAWYCMVLRTQER
jgi:predicted RNA binding protein YcfA (HicA-like mRNA interferase family)